MHRTVRAVVALGITLILALLGAAGIASAQEMEHGRSRPTAQAAATNNKVRTQDAIMVSYAGYIRG
jgi:hypothetical protein